MNRLLYYTSLLLLSLFIEETSAQNLVPNTDFEDHGDCSSGPNSEGADLWYAPMCSSSPVYFNACAPSVYFYESVPTNRFGSQIAHSGEGYIGLFTYFENFGNINGYASTTLFTTLEQGVEYCLSFWMSLGDSSLYKTSTFHAFFSHDTLSACNDQDEVWPFAAQIEFNTAQVDTSSWKFMQGSFTALGTERLLTMGNFLHGPDLEADVDSSGGVGSVLGNVAAYYIDDVVLTRCDVGIEEQVGSKIKVYPVPAEVGETIFIELPVGIASANVTVELYDQLGRLVLSSRGLQLATDRLSPGPYTLRISGELDVYYSKFLLL